MKFLVLIFLLFSYLNSYGQVSPRRNWVDSEVKHTDSKGNTVMMTNSLPKGGGVVYQNEKKYSYVVFWTRVFNQSATSIELKIKFPEITFLKSPDSFIQIILPKASMSMEIQSIKCPPKKDKTQRRLYFLYCRFHSYRGLGAFQG